jgi:hypothetical protein
MRLYDPNATAHDHLNGRSGQPPIKPHFCPTPGLSSDPAWRISDLLRSGEIGSEPQPRCRLLPPGSGENRKTHGYGRIPIFPVKGKTSVVTKLPPIVDTLFVAKET